jgi:hypothetical protein
MKLPRLRRLGVSAESAVALSSTIPSSRGMSGACVESVVSPHRRVFNETKNHEERLQGRHGIESPRAES